MLAHVHILIQADDIIAVIHEADFPLLGPAPKASVKDYPRKYVSSSSLSTPSSSSSSSLSSPSGEAADAGLGPAEDEAVLEEGCINIWKTFVATLPPAPGKDIKVCRHAMIIYIQYHSTYPISTLCFLI